jgi:hypothetical protein
MAAPPLRIRTDVHQHLWPEPLVSALTWRREPPSLRRSDAGPTGWVLRLRDEPDHPFDPAEHDPDTRARQLRADGVQRALLALSSPLPSGELRPHSISYAEELRPLGHAAAA